MVVPNGSIGFRWGEQGKWNLREGRQRRELKLRLSRSTDDHDEIVGVGFPISAARAPTISSHATTRTC